MRSVVFLRRKMGSRRVPGQSLYAPHASRDGAFLNDLNEPDLTRRPHMRSTAKLDREDPGPFIVVACLTHRNDANFLSIFLSEESHGARFNCVFHWHQPRHNRAIPKDDRICKLLHRGEFFFRQRFRMRKIETQLIGIDKRTFLRDVRAQGLAKGLMQQMCCGMICPDCGAARMVDMQLDRVPYFECPFLNLANMSKNFPSFFWVSVTSK